MKGTKIEQATNPRIKLDVIKIIEDSKEKVQELKSIQKQNGDWSLEIDIIDSDRVDSEREVQESTRQK